MIYKGKKTKLKLSSFAVLFFSIVLFNIESPCADRTIVDIDLYLKNIAIDKDRKSESLGEREGAAMNIGQFQQSSADFFITDADFPNKKAQKKYYDLEKQTLSGRSVVVDYKLINYEFDADTAVKDRKSYRLFDLGWFRYRIDYAWKDANGKWQKGFSIPETFFFDKPSTATIVGIGDVKVEIPGMRFEIKPKFNFGNLEEVYKADTYKIVLTKYLIPKRLIAVPDENLLNDKISPEKKYQVLGKANIGDTAIVTEIPPFWYPFDRYAFRFIYKTFYDVSLNIEIPNIEDLDLETKDKFSVSLKKDEIYTFKSTLYRKQKFRRLFLPILLAIIPILCFFKPIRERIWIRSLTYLSSIGVLYVTLPSPINVPKINLCNIIVCLILLSLILYFEITGKIRSNKQQLISD